MPTMYQVVAVDVDAYDPALPGVRTLRFSSHSFATGPTDVPANTYYDGRIKQPGNFERSTFANQRTAGVTQIGYGEVVLSNVDGALDPLLEYAFTGRPVTIRLGTMPEGSPPGGWSTIIRGTLEQAEFSWQEVTLRIRDRQLDLAKPLQSVRYAGTGGAEGGANLTGKPKPLVFGSVRNVEPVLLDADRFIYQLHSGSQLTSLEVYDAGAKIGAESAYSSFADMVANAPSPGAYRVWSDATAGTYFRVGYFAGASGKGRITCDAVRGSAVSSRTPAQLFSQILVAAGVSPSDISSADISALDSVAPFDSGAIATHEKDWTAIDLLDLVCSGAGAWYGTDAVGQYRIGRIVSPSGTASATLTAVEILSIDRVASRDVGAGIPAWRVSVGYQRNHSKTADVSWTVTAADRAFFAEEYRKAWASDTSVLTAYPLSPEIDFPTQLLSASDAASEATRRLNLYKVRRDVYRVTVRVDPTLAGAIDLGRVVELVLPRFGMGAGKKFLVIGIQADMRLSRYVLTLWG